MRLPPEAEEKAQALLPQFESEAKADLASHVEGRGVGLGMARATYSSVRLLIVV